MARDFVGRGGGGGEASAYTNPRKQSICRCCKSEDVTSVGSAYAWSGGRSREEGAGDLEINNLRSKPPHPDLVIS